MRALLTFTAIIIGAFTGFTIKAMFTGGHPGSGAGAEGLAEVQEEAEEAAC